MSPLSNLTLANVTTLVGPLANLTTLNVASGTMTSLVAANVYAANVTAPLANITTLNVSSTLSVNGAFVSNSTNTTFLFDTFTIPYLNTLNILAQGTSNINVLNVTNVISQGYFGNASGLSNLNASNLAFGVVSSDLVYGNTLSNIQASNIVQPFGNLVVSNSVTTTNIAAGAANVGVLNVGQISNLARLTTNLTASVANVTTLNVSSLETTGNLSVSGNIIPVTQGNTYVQGNVVVSGNVYSSLGELGVGGSLFFSLGAPYTPGYFTGNVPVTGTQTNTIRISAFTQQGTSTYIRTSANGCFQFTQTGVYTLASNFLTNFNNILGIGIGSNVIDYGTRTDQTYLYSLIPFISQNPTAILEAQFYVSDLTKYYYVDAFSVDGVELQPTSSPSGTWISVAPLGGVAAASQTVVLSTLGNTVTGQGTNYGAQITDYYIGCSAGISVSLPNGATLTAGKQYVIKDESGNAAVNHITIQPYSGNLIDGQTSLVLVISYGAVTLYWTGANWSIV